MSVGMNGNLIQIVGTSALQGNQLPDRGNVNIQHISMGRNLRSAIGSRPTTRRFPPHPRTVHSCHDRQTFSLLGKKLYLSPILDLCSKDIVSYTISDRPVLSMVTTMLDKAFEQLPNGTNLILHSDQGWHYQHKQYQRMLNTKGIRQSMSRKGNCLDNAVIENFFGLLKSELLYLQKFDSIDQFKTELINYLDYYNNRRIKAKLKGLPPAIHRQQALSAA